MRIIFYRRGGLLALVAFAAVALVTTFVAVAVVATTLIVALGLAIVGLAVRALLPASWRRRRAAVPPNSPWPHDTIDTSAVKRIE